MRRVVGGLLLCGLALCGCSGASDPEPGTQGTAQTAETLWSARTPYVGDNSKVAALVDRLGPVAEHVDGIALQTTARPYGLTVNLDTADEPVADADLDRAGTLLLGLVQNLDEVTFAREGQPSAPALVLTADQASTTLGFDVKQLGRDRTALTSFLAG